MRYQCAICRKDFDLEINPSDFRNLFENLYFICHNCYLQNEMKRDLDGILKYLREKHPYPSDLMKLPIGRAARVGYESAISIIKDYFEEETE